MTSAGEWKAIFFSRTNENNILRAMEKSIFFSWEKADVDVQSNVLLWVIKKKKKIKSYILRKEKERGCNGGYNKMQNLQWISEVILVFETFRNECVILPIL